MPQWVEPWSHMVVIALSVCVCVCVCVPLLCRFLDKHLKLLSKHSMILSCHYFFYLWAHLELVAWNTCCDDCCQQYRVKWRPSCPLQTTFQHDSSICTKNQSATWVKCRERDCQSYRPNYLIVTINCVFFINFSDFKNPWFDLTYTHFSIFSRTVL